MTPFFAPESIGRPPLWTVLPFVAYLLIIAILPLALGRLWERHRFKMIVTVAAVLPTAAWLLASHGGHLLLESLTEYAAFITLLASLFVISGSISLRGSLAGTPRVNTACLAVGALLASFIGTTGASMLLIRPLLRANEKRTRRTHLVIFFIFIVSNGGGMLTPLGDPPLFLGFLRGVPFLWTLQLFGPWALVNGVLLVLFCVVDRAHYRKEAPAQEPPQPLRIAGLMNLVWLIGVIAINSGVGYFGRVHGWDEGVRKLLLIVGTGAMAALSFLTTKAEVRHANRFTWAPILEVSILFLGIFLTMVPATVLLQEMGKSGELRLTSAAQFFWGTGLVSSFLDNAPTYVTFASLACGVVGGDPADLARLLAHPQGALYLKAISCGAVLMGANTYIGNGPNFMVKAIAEEGGVKMPGFFGYLGWSLVILIPIFGLVTLLFFR